MPQPGLTPFPHGPLQGEDESRTFPAYEPPLVTDSLILLVFDLYSTKHNGNKFKDNASDV